MKKIISLMLAVVFILPIIACSSNNESEIRPEAYDYELLKADDEILTYEYFRYMYYFVKDQYLQNNVDYTIDEIKEQILQKVKRDIAVRKLLQSYFQQLTDEERTNCKEYIAMLQTNYGSSFSSVLQEQMNATLDVFTTITINEYEYNKLYTYISDEKNDAIDFSDDAVREYLDNFKAGMHIVLLNSNHDEKEAEKLISDIYTMALLDESFETFRNLHKLSESMNDINESISKINEQIESGNEDASLSEKLATLTKQLTAISTQISNKLSELDLEGALDNYLEKLISYKKYVLDIVNKSINSNDAAMVSLLDGDFDALKKAIVSSINETISSTLSSKAKGYINDKSAYGWLPSDFKDAVSEFEKENSYENAVNISDIISSNSDLKKNGKIAELGDCFRAYSLIVSNESTMYTIFSSITDLSGVYDELKLTKSANFALYAAVREAENEANNLKGVKENVFSAIEAAYDKLSGIVVPFEQLCMNYSDDYTDESESAIYYFKPETLLPELIEATKELKSGEMTGIVHSSTGLHILKLTEPDIDYFKKNEYSYYVLEDMLTEKSEDVKVSADDNFKNLDETIINDFEKEIAEALGTSSNETELPEEDNSNYVLITIIVIAATVAVVAVLVVLIVSAGNDGKGGTKKNTKNAKTSIPAQKKSSKK